MADNHFKIHKGATFAPQNSEPSSPINGDMYYDSTLNLFRLYQNGRWVNFGSGSGELNFYDIGDAETAGASDFSTGNNATFDGGGTLNGTFSITTTAAELIRGDASFKYLSGATAGANDNDYIATNPIDIPQGYRGQFLAIKLRYRWEGSNGNLKWVVKDTTNGTILTNGSETLDQFVPVDEESKPFTLVFYCPSDCEQIEMGPQVITGESSVALVWDDVVLTPNPFLSKELYDFFPRTNILSSDQTANGTIADLTFTDLVPGRLYELTVQADMETTASEANMTIEIVHDSVTIGQLRHHVREGNDTLDEADIILSTTAKFVATADTLTFVGSNIAGDRIIGTGGRDATYAQLVDLSPIDGALHHETGTENTFSARIANNGSASITSQSSPNSPPIQSVNRTGTGEVDVTFTPGFFNVIPAVVAVVTNGAGANTEQVDIRSLTTSGFTLLTEGVDGTNQDQDVDLIIQFQGTDYKNPQAFAITPLTRTVFVKDVKSNGTDGGGFTGGAWQTRELNTLEGDLGFITLNSNQFTLQPGKYRIKAKAPAYSDSGAIDRHKLKLRDITNGADVVIGDSAFVSTSSVTTISSFKTILTITEPTTFEVQHRCQTTQGTFGFGLSSSFGVDEVYAQVEIVKLK